MISTLLINYENTQMNQLKEFSNSIHFEPKNESGKSCFGIKIKGNDSISECIE